MADAKAATDVTQAYTTLQGGDIFGVERGGVFGKHTWSNFQALDMTLTGTIDFSSATLTFPASVSFTALSASGVLSVASDIQHVGDTDNKIAFGTDTQSFETGGTSRLDLSDSGVRMGATGARVTDIETTITDSDTKLPTSGAVVDYVDTNASSATLSSSQATTSGATHDITGLPSGINSIDVILNRVSLDGTDSLLIQLGDSGGFEATGYVSHSNTFTTGVSGISSTAGFIIRVAQAAATISGTLRLRRQTGNAWVADGVLRTGTDGSNFTVNSAGEKTLSAELTQIRLTHNGSNSFDGGAYSILYS